MRLLALAVLFVCTACGGGSGGSEPNKYEGFWYNASVDSYLQVERSGRVYDRRCTVYDGYQADENLIGQISEDSLNFRSLLSPVGAEGFTYELTLNDQQLVLTYGAPEDNSNIELSKVDSVPSYCDADAVEITFSSPTHAIAGDRTSFVVNFDYRLSSVEEGEIRLGYPEMQNAYALVQEKFELADKGTGAGSIMATIRPTFLGDGEVYSLLLLDLDDSTTRALASDVVAVDISDDDTVSSKPLQLSISSGEYLYPHDYLNP